MRQLAPALVLVIGVVLVACTDGINATFELTFDGNECVAEGPNEVPPGEITVHLVNESDILVGTSVRWLDDGYTFQDWLDTFPPGEWNANANIRPSWIHDVTYLGSGLEEGVQLPMGDTVSRWRVRSQTESGEHEIHVGVLNEALWGCTGFVVTGG